MEGLRGTKPDCGWRAVYRGGSGYQRILTTTKSPSSAAAAAMKRTANPASFLVRRDANHMTTRARTNRPRMNAIRVSTMVLVRSGCGASAELAAMAPLPMTGHTSMKPLPWRTAPLQQASHAARGNLANHHSTPKNREGRASNCAFPTPPLRWPSARSTNPATPDGRQVPHALAHEQDWPDRKSTRLNSSHGYISYAVFFFKKKKNH